jgi:hypothetical protein
VNLDATEFRILKRKMIGLPNSATSKLGHKVSSLAISKKKAYIILKVIIEN